jgi:hypothetical protein
MIEAAIAEAVRSAMRDERPVLVAEIARQVIDELRASADAEWRSPAAHARAKGLSVDTVARQIARGDLDVQELSRVPLRGRNGEQLRDREGKPRWRRTLRVRLRRRPTDAEIAAIAAEARR